jgi:hypothetical protein
MWAALSINFLAGLVIQLISRLMPAFLWLKLVPSLLFFLCDQRPL